MRTRSLPRFDALNSTKKMKLPQMLIEMVFAREHDLDIFGLTMRAFVRLLLDGMLRVYMTP
jgi:hypothetical protein